jgi:hypothetical protein
MSFNLSLVLCFGLFFNSIAFEIRDNWNPFPELSPECKNKLETDDKNRKCRTDILNDWTIIDGQTHHFSEHKDYCCYEWDVFDCNSTAAKRVCNSSAYENDLKAIEEWIKRECADYRHNS